MSVRWRSPSDGRLAWAEYGDRFVVYHRLSSQTHFLNAASAMILQDLLSQPAGLETVHAALVQAQTDAGQAGADEALPPAVLRQSIAETLLRFEELGLVERIDEP
ncbi:MAG: HPr-rel-A system PqqD family peptide chaperone [Burkholderiaceae bacterium]